MVVVVLVAQLAGGIMGFIYRDQLSTFVTKGLNHTLERYGGTTSSDHVVTVSWDFVQEIVSNIIIFYIFYFTL